MSSVNLLAERTKCTSRENRLDRQLEVLADTKSEFKAGIEIATLEISDRLVVDLKRIGQVSPAQTSFSPQNGNAVKHPP